MLVIRIELWPFGDETQKRELGFARIINDGTGTSDIGHYNVEINEEGEPTRKICVSSFPRRRLGPWDLLYRALRDSMRNR